VFIVHNWSQQVYELIAWLRSANQNGRNPLYLVQFLIILFINYTDTIVRQISVKSGVSTALYDKSIKLGTLKLDTMGNIFKIRGNRHMFLVSQERVVKVLGIIIPNGRRQRYFFGLETYSIIV